MRCVDADELTKTIKEIIEGIGVIDDPEITRAVKIFEGMMIAHVDIMADTEGVEIVRCKDCKWSDWYTAGDGSQYCYCMETGNGGRTENDFCSYAERSSDEAD